MVLAIGSMVRDFHLHLLSRCDNPGSSPGTEQCPADTPNPSGTHMMEVGGVIVGVGVIVLIAAVSALVSGRTTVEPMPGSKEAAKVSPPRAPQWRTVDWAPPPVPAAQVFSVRF